MYPANGISSSKYRPISYAITHQKHIQSTKFNRERKSFCHYNDRAYTLKLYAMKTLLKRLPTVYIQSPII